MELTDYSSGTDTKTITFYGSGADTASLPSWLSFDLANYSGTGNVKVTVDKSFVGSWGINFRAYSGNRDFSGSDFQIRDIMNMKAEVPTFTHDGKTYAVAIAGIYESGGLFMHTPGSGTGGSGAIENGFEMTRIVGIMENYNTATEREAVEMYKYIKNVQYSIKRFRNADGSTGECWLDLSDINVDRGNAIVPGVRGVADGQGEALLWADITIELPQMAPFTVSSWVNIHWLGDQQFVLDLGQGENPVDTVEELNAILASDDALLAYFKERNPEGYAAYEYFKTNPNVSSNRIMLKLPAVTYTGIIESHTSSALNLLIDGTTITRKDESGTILETVSRTTISGGIFIGNGISEGKITNRGDLGRIYYIRFVENKDYTRVIDGEAVTVGIYSDIGECDIGFCSFEGFSYAIYNEKNGYSHPDYNNYFKGNGVAVYYNSGIKNQGNANAEVRYSVFEDNDIAIWIDALPSYIQPYDYRVYGCDFINNQHDFRAETVKGSTFWFIGNFFGRTKESHDPNRGLDELDIREVQQRKANTIVNGPGRVITDPSWRVRNNWITIRGDRVWEKSLEERIGMTLTVDADAIAMLNGSASQFRIDAATFEEKDTLEITMEDENETILGIWNFN